jgi:hypothetical protein
VNVMGPGAGNPSGSVRFKDGGVALGAPVGVTNGKAVFAIGLGVGFHALTAEYLGVASFNPSGGTLDGGLTVLSPTPVPSPTPSPTAPTGGSSMYIPAALYGLGTN